MVETSPRYVMLFLSAAFVCRSALDEDGAGEAQRGENCMHSHFYALGQQVSYAEDGIAWPWKGGFEVIALLPASTDEAAYRIRNAEQAYDRIVCEHELSETYGQTRTSRTRSLD